MLLVFFLGILIICISTSFALYGAEDPVTRLSDKNFDEYISQPGVTVVKFYASWCGHCEKFAPKFKKAASVLQVCCHTKNSNFRVLCILA